MPKTVCVKCEVEIRLETNRVVVAEMFQNNTQVCKLWRADLWKCPICNTEIITGFNSYPFMEHDKGNITETISKIEESGRRIIYNRELIEDLFKEQIWREV